MFVFTKIEVENLGCTLAEMYNNYQFLSMFSAPPNYITLQDELPQVVESRDETGAKNLFVFRVSRNVITVYNSFYCRVSDRELKDFVTYLFGEYGPVKILWRGLIDALPIECCQRPYFRYSMLSDNIANLPDSFPEYLDSLGTKTKKHSKYYINRLSRDFNSVDYVFKYGNDVSDEEFDRLCMFSAERIRRKNMKYGANDADETLRNGIKSKYGYGLFVVVDGEIQAGSIGYIIGQHLYFNKIAHNPNLNKYNIGNVALLKLIEIAIKEGVTKFHFLWGKNVDYKVRYGGVNVPLLCYAIYEKSGFAFYSDKIQLELKLKKERAKEYLRGKKALWKYMRIVKFKIQNRKNE